MCLFCLFCRHCLSILKQILDPIGICRKKCEHFLTESQCHDSPNTISDNCLASWNNQSTKFKASLFSHHSLFHKENYLYFPALQYFSKRHNEEMKK